MTICNKFATNASPIMERSECFMKTKIDWMKFAGVAGMALSVVSALLTTVSQDRKINKTIDEKVTEKVTEALTKH